mmetsp:Transcript_62131/g.161463  ORF Transcript_62131/g.161463 Transcript_62131/m.161463 type:complete len:150 (+) Transcript_62131:86-535(+)
MAGIGLVIVAVLLFINVSVSAAFYYDKNQAQSGGHRIKRFHLAGLLWLAPFLPFAAMVYLHHKTRKRLFVGSATAAGAAQVLVLCYVIAKVFESHSGGDGALLLVFTMILGAIWCSAIAVQIHRGCPCEPSSVHTDAHRGGVTLGSSAA